METEQIVEDITLDCNRLLEQELGIEGHYRIIGPIGSGGMGEVFRAYQLDMDRDVAIKILSAEIKDSPDATERFMREAKVLSTLDHPNIVKFYTYGFSKKRPYQIVDFLKGTTLSDRLEKGPLSLVEFHSIFTQIGDALKYSSQRGIVHRDIKPANIFLCPEPDGSIRAVLLDFGLVRQLQIDGATLTTTMTIVGSPLYMSPEQCKGGRVDCRSDIYCLGCTMFEALSGRPPFQGEAVMDVMFKHINGPPPLLPAFVAGEPFNCDLSILIERCLSKDPDMRPANFEELLARLNDGFGACPQNVEFVAPEKKRKYLNSRLIFCAAAVIIVSLSLMCYSRIQTASSIPFLSRNFEAERRTEISHEISQIADLERNSGKLAPTSYMYKHDAITKLLVANWTDLAKWLKKNYRYEESVQECKRARRFAETESSDAVARLLQLQSEVHLDQARSITDKTKKTELLEEALSDIIAARKVASADKTKLFCQEDYCLRLAETGRLEDTDKETRALIKAFQKSAYMFETLPPTIRGFAENLQKCANAGKAAFTTNDQFIMCDMFLELCQALEELKYFLRNEASLKLAHLWFEKACANLPDGERNSKAVLERKEKLAHFDELETRSRTRQLSPLFESSHDPERQPRH